MTTTYIVHWSPGAHKNVRKAAVVFSPPPLPQGFPQGRAGLASVSIPLVLGDRKGFGSGRKRRLDDQVLMISTLEGLKDVLGQESEHFTVESIDYVTPGFMNETGRWQIESLVEITELSNDGGWGIPRCKVNDKRVYRELSLEPVPEFWNEQVIFRDKKSK
jgi:hypothetical protein